eukprot:CAMPEP_0202470442 /NCGR_PEP_ID=MMETSP1360-20130828/81642_1 /ASSEMBLY_ACC=CAM_ASM_000848 /TAXON_ID=515479 /ORGANISM="Licmophora paradoxa, Strain CCMP2313" /LENGTH=72 /DNA_ID=CAMNT_0049096151 /DNA_START=30 /DNA_END=245 /DNA_ORIENTATION=+
MYCLVDNDNGNGNDNGAIVGWISIRQRGPTKYQVREFGCHDTAPASVAQVFPPLLQRAMKDHVQEKEDDSDH